jgi:hypothetical protein
MTNPSPREVIAATIGRHDHNRIPEGYGSEIDHPDASDWSVYLADHLLEALRSRGYEIRRIDDGKDD